MKMTEKKITRKHVAKLLNLSEPTISRYLKQIIPLSLNHFLQLNEILENESNTRKNGKKS